MTGSLHDRPVGLSGTQFELALSIARITGYISLSTSVPRECV